MEVDALVIQSVELHMLQITQSLFAGTYTSTSSYTVILEKKNSRQYSCIIGFSLVFDSILNLENIII